MPLQFLSYADSFFWVFAIAGTLLFLLRFLLMFVGFGEGEGMGPDHADADFKMLSMHSLTGFFMIFGWSGLAALHQFDLLVGWAALVALGCGLFAIFVLRLLFSGATKLVSRGRVLNLKEAVGKRGLVYQRIPSIGSGKVIMTLHGFQYELEAISADAEEIPSFTQVEVIRALEGQKVLVIQK